MGKFPLFNHYLGGFRPNELTLLCAPTGSGKTALIATWAAEVGKQNIPVFAAPVETGDVDFTTRIISAESGFDLNTGDKFKPEFVKNAWLKATNVLTAPIVISTYDSRVEMEEMIAVLEVMSARGIKLAVLDNLNFFLKICSTDYERAVLDEAIHEFVMFVKRLPMHVVLIVHPRKTENGRVISEFDIKGSATAVQEASNVILFNRPTQEDLDSNRSMSHRELVFKKIRKRGMFVNKPIWMEYKQGGYVECDLAEHFR